MTYRSHRKRALFLDSPKANAGRLGGWEAGRPDSRERGSRFQVAPATGSSTGSRFGETGFTLIEVIATLIIIAVLAAMIFSVTTGQWRTAKGVGDCQELFALQGQMEAIVQVYQSQLIDGGGTINLVDFLDTVDGYSYVDSGSTGFVTESGSDLTLSASPTSLLLITLTSGDQRIADIFAGD